MWMKINIKVHAMQFKVIVLFKKMYDVHERHKNNEKDHLLKAFIEHIISEKKKQKLQRVNEYVENQ
jgi:hypothetical protein